MWKRGLFLNQHSRTYFRANQELTGYPLARLTLPWIIQTAHLHADQDLGQNPDDFLSEQYSDQQTRVLVGT